MAKKKETKKVVQTPQVVKPLEPTPRIEKPVEPTPQVVKQQRTVIATNKS